MRTSEDKVCRKDMCWSVRIVCVLVKLPDVSGPGLGEAGRYNFTTNLSINHNFHDAGKLLFYSHAGKHKPLSKKLLFIPWQSNLYFSDMRARQRHAHSAIFTGQPMLKNMKVIENVLNTPWPCQPMRIWSDPPQTTLKANQTLKFTTDSSNNRNFHATGGGAALRRGYWILFI